MSKGKPIPVRFEVEEAEGIRSLAQRTRLPEAEVIRRAVRLLLWSVKISGLSVLYESLEPASKAAEEPPKEESAKKPRPRAA